MHNSRNEKCPGTTTTKGVNVNAKADDVMKKRLRQSRSFMGGASRRKRGGRRELLRKKNGYEERVKIAGIQN